MMGTHPCEGSETFARVSNSLISKFVIVIGGFLMYAQTIRKQVWLSTALRALLLAALAVALWMLIPARAAWAEHRSSRRNPSTLRVMTPLYLQLSDGSQWRPKFLSIVS